MLISDVLFNQKEMALRQDHKATTTSMPTHPSGAAANRILTNAAILFARFGYNGVSTREIATTSGVNEVTVYRLFKRKRNLYCAVLEAQFKKVQLGGDLLSSLAHAPDGRAALERTFALISHVLAQDPSLIRLVHFCALDLDDDVALLLRKHLAELIEVVAGYLDPWIESGQLPTANSRALVVTMAGFVCSAQSFARIFEEARQRRKIFCDYTHYFYNFSETGTSEGGEEIGPLSKLGSTEYPSGQ